jgi:hypothetical protein
MMPEEFEYKEILKFTLKLNTPQLSSQTKEMHKAYDHFKEQEKKAFHCKVAKENVPYFHFLAGQAVLSWKTITLGNFPSSWARWRTTLH